MPRVTWPLRYGRPSICVVLTLPDGRALPLDLLANTGGGANGSPFDLLLEETDCWLCGGQPGPAVSLYGADYSGSHPIFALPVQIPSLGFDRDVAVVGVRHGPPGFDGIACFSFLQRFAYGNFGVPGEFGLENHVPAPIAREEAGGRPLATGTPVDEDAVVQRLNRLLARRINDEALRDPSSPYAGKFVGVANGEVAIVAEDWKTVHRHLDEIEPNHRRRCWIEASRDYTIPVRV